MTDRKRRHPMDVERLEKLASDLGDAAASTEPVILQRHEGHPPDPLAPLTRRQRDMLKTLLGERGWRRHALAIAYITTHTLLNVDDSFRGYMSAELLVLDDGSVVQRKTAARLHLFAPLSPSDLPHQPRPNGGDRKRDRRLARAESLSVRPWTKFTNPK